MPSKRVKTIIDINVRGIGKVEFVSGRNKAMDSVYGDDYETWKPLCPGCKNEISSQDKKVHTSATVYICPHCSQVMPKSTVHAHEINAMRKAAWDEAHPRTLSIDIQAVIPMDKMPQFAYDNKSIDYLVPNRTPANLPLWKDFIGMLVASRSVAITSAVRERSGSGTAKRKIITVARDRKALVIMDLLPPSIVREPNIDAVFETLPSNLDAVVKKSKALRVEKDIEIIKVLG